MHGSEISLTNTYMLLKFKTLKFLRATEGNDSVVDYEYSKCGYGKLIWPDGSSFEGYWING